LKTNQLAFDDLEDFINCYRPNNHFAHKGTERFHGFACDDLVKRDKAGPDIFWWKDDSLEDSANLPNPDVLATEIADNLEAALEQFRGISEELGKE